MIKSLAFTVATAAATAASPQPSSPGPRAMTSITLSGAVPVMSSASRMPAASVRDCGLGLPTTTVLITDHHATERACDSRNYVCLRQPRGAKKVPLPVEAWKRNSGSDGRRSRDLSIFLHDRPLDGRPKARQSPVFIWPISINVIEEACSDLPRLWASVLNTT